MEELALSVGGFALGIFLRSVFALGYAAIFFALLLAFICFIARLVTPRRAYMLGGVFFLLLALGILRMDVADTPPPKLFAAQLKHRVSYEGIIASDPDRRDAEQLVYVRVTQSGETTKILALAPLYETVVVGERVRLSGVLQAPQPFATDGGRTFAYDKYLQKDGVRFEIFHAYLDEVAPAPWYSPTALFARIKHLFIGGIERTLPQPNAALAAGIAIGGKSGLGDALKQAFTTSGLLQIVVLSGYNVMLVAEGALLLFARFRLSRRYAALLGGVAVLLFVLIAGLSSTAIRAALMALIALYARASGRSYAASRALCAAVFLMLLWNPLTLAYDPGFGLSVAATAGLIWLSPLIERKLARIKNDFWRTGLATTLAAQLAVLPLLLYDTGSLSLVSLPANLLAMPAVPLAMAAAALAATAGMTGLPFAGIFAYPARISTGYLIWLAKAASALPLAAVPIPAFSFWLVIAAYAALGYIAFAKRSSMTVQLRLSKKASI